MINLEQLPCGAFTIDENRRIALTNSEWETISGYAPGDTTGLEELKFFHVDEDEEMDFAYCMFPGGPEKLQKSVRLKTKQGALKLVHVSVRLLGQPSHYALFTVCDLSQDLTCSLITAVNPLNQPERIGFYNMIGKTSKMQELYRMIELAADSNVTVLISGESGTGKELAARAIHYHSPRKRKPFVAINCSALTETLLESELFGHVKGSFTGAYRDKTGKFEAAEGGSIFLDEIGEISPMIQVKLLRVIQEKVIQRVGDNKEIHVDMRVMAATNKNLREEVRKGNFREDLFYRLNVFALNTPPLRERMNDIRVLVDHFINKFNKTTGKSIQGLTEDAYRTIMDYCWPGNVRELENCIEHAFVVCHNAHIDLKDLPHEIRNAQAREGLCQGLTNGQTALQNEPVATNPLRQDARQMLELLQKNNYNKTKTARQLGISRVALWKRLKKLDNG